MFSMIRSWLARRTARGLAVVALLAGLVATQAAYADGTTNTITLYAPGAPAGAWTSVEWQDPAGAWHAVEGWQGALDTMADDDLVFTQWAVDSANADQGPFRWVVYASRGGAVWGVSDTFNLPGGVGTNLEVTVLPATSATTASATAAAETATTPTATSSAATTAADTTGVPRVAADSSTWYFDCLGCDHGLITVYLPDAPAGSSVGVQYQLPDDTWQNVAGWQGLASVDDAGQQYTQWSVSPENYGQGPFRWVVTEPDGDLWGISPDFDLPTQGVNYILFLLRA